MQPTNVTYGGCSLPFEKRPMCFMDSRPWNVPLPVFCRLVDASKMKSMNRDSPSCTQHASTPAEFAMLTSFCTFVFIFKFEDTSTYTNFSSKVGRFITYFQCICRWCVIRLVSWSIFILFIFLLYFKLSYIFVVFQYQSIDIYLINISLCCSFIIIIRLPLLLNNAYLM